MLESFYGLIASGGLWLLFLLVFLEGNPILGSFVPGQILVALVGVLIATTGIFPLYLTLIIVFLGAFLGDLAGFYFGRRYGYKGLKVFGLNKESSVYKSSEAFFEKCGSWSIILGREFNLTRAFIPFFAGLSKMTGVRFTFLAFVSNVIWTLLSVFLGYYFGFAIVDTLEFLLAFLAFLSIYGFVMYIIYKFFRKLYEQHYKLLKSYALHNLFYIIGLIFFLIFLLFLKALSLEHLVNNYLSPLFLPLLAACSFVFTKIFLMLFFEAIFLATLFLRRIKLFLIFLWGTFFYFFMMFFFVFFLNKFFGMVLSFSLVFYVLGLFYCYIFMNEHIKNNSLKKWIQSLIMFLMFFGILIRATIDNDMFSPLVSFLVAAIGCEFLLVLSHYRVLDVYLSKSMNKNS